MEYFASNVHVADWQSLSALQLPQSDPYVSKFDLTEIPWHGFNSAILQMASPEGYPSMSENQQQTNQNMLLTGDIAQGFDNMAPTLASNHQIFQQQIFLSSREVSHCDERKLKSNDRRRMQNRKSQREFRRRQQEETKKLRQELSQMKEDHSILLDHTQKLQAKLEETETSYRGLLAAVKLLKMEFCMPLFHTDED